MVAVLPERTVALDQEHDKEEVEMLDLGAITEELDDGEDSPSKKPVTAEQPPPLTSEWHAAQKARAIRRQVRADGGQYHGMNILRLEESQMHVDMPDFGDGDDGDHEEWEPEPAP